MGIDYNDNMGVLDMTDSLVVTVDDEGSVTGSVKGEIPVNDQGDPYRFGLRAMDQNGGEVLITTDMDYQTLLAEPPPLE